MIALRLSSTIFLLVAGNDPNSNANGMASDKSDHQSRRDGRSGNIDNIVADEDGREHPLGVALELLDIMCAKALVCQHLLCLDS